MTARAMVHPQRMRMVRAGQMGPGPVIYWMSRDQRSHDNWALLAAQEQALTLKVPLGVVFSLAPRFGEASLRAYAFMIEGLKEVEQSLAGKGIPFFCLPGDPEKEIPRFLGKVHAACLFSDFDPQRIKRRWKERVAAQVSLPFWEVDAHNIVPCWKASDKQEYGAYTFRPKIRRLLDEFLEEFPPLLRHPFPWKGKLPVHDWEAWKDRLPVDRSVSEVNWLRAGEKAAKMRLASFLAQGLSTYDQRRNDPNEEGQSGLSPYLHFGQLSAQRVALEVRKSKAPLPAQKAFLEELIVRRELADNYCFYNDSYDRPEGFPAWARRTLREHLRDQRPYLYTPDQLEKALTHDPLWNAAQREMVQTGKMHGYIRMYWAKKILEWTTSPEEAQRIAVYLNDKYELDGRDPNGYCGIAWSLGGLHDRAWGERPVFGKVRTMSYQGARRKFDVIRYVRRFPG